MTLSISRPEPGARLGADQCPGVDQRGHGLTMAVIHDAGCCQEWETGQAATPARAESFRQAAARWGMAWPQQRQHPAAGTESEAEPEAERLMVLTARWVVPVSRTGAAPGNQPAQKASPRFLHPLGLLSPAPPEGAL